MHEISFFPLGNADCCRIDRRDPADKKDRRIDLPAELKKDL